MPVSANRPSAARRPPYAICAGTILLLTACGNTSQTAGGTQEVRAASSASAGVAGPQAAGDRGRAAPGPYAPRLVPREIPALGPRTRGGIPAGARQALVVTGDSYDSSLSTAVLYTRDDPAGGWRAATGRWPAHNGLNGWTDEHWEGDLRTPVGVYGLTAAGGRFEPPETAFPYEQRPEFAVSGEGFEGETLEGSFDYVVAVDYNRVPGASPLDPVRPLGQERGGGIWIHVDHGGPTQGCISLPENRMRELLRILDPEKKPVVVIGDVEGLER
ncbi:MULTISPECIES: L,D-transpeptidase family protein [unclassified Streptomyces]|uniref:L,D-transpeptidase family protein n=1 Tax=unclassified Streptomyces TaxID=2593676 RepID=UPI0022518D2B|nr:MULTISPECIES: L,D-transpeptidase family protein [unclassified Streptomyces]MCX4787860.1 L,D-transpeptidase family protein [Streptomyces sp. NBC_01221]WSP56157.1 L,D-transpeptidase family protein [Streptomyces sp. NBC_01241]WSP64012.1 L,D-transpeptidase family protein [Streptomyces sp. NBC_01240]WSU23146.1 L,D-transpeptidase family protein [Streptomyces sp. NBC_01108]